MKKIYVAVILLGLFGLLSCSKEPANLEDPWESVTHIPGEMGGHALSTHRLRVPNGWLYRESCYGGSHGVALCFVPDTAPVKS